MLNDRRLHTYEKDPSPSSDTPVNLLGFILTRMIPTSDRTRGCSIHLTQNIGIISNTSSQGKLFYLASSLHVAFTAQKVVLTIPWCRAKWNYRQRESTTQRLCENHALTSARLAMHRKWRSSNYAWEISPPASLREKSKKDWITSGNGMQSIDQPCPTSARRQTNLQTVRGAYRDNPAIEEKRKVLTG